VNFEENVWKDVGWIHLTGLGLLVGCCEYGLKPSVSINAGNFLTRLLSKSAAAWS
jgi:hypothetical protein